MKAYDFDGTLFDNKTGQLTPLGEEVKRRIKNGEDIKIVTARDADNVQEIKDVLGISDDKIKATGDESKKGQVLDGMGISRNEYYDADKQKLDNLRSNIQEGKPKESKQKTEQTELNTAANIKIDETDGAKKIGTTPPLTKEAEELLTAADRGEMPKEFTEDIERIAAENGVTLTDNTTPTDLINALKEKQKTVAAKNWQKE